MEYSRMIKLLLPTGNLINLHLGGEDKELKDLISTITEISPNQVKGIKDSKGNYYTISSAIKSINIVNSNDDYFELIYSKLYHQPSHSKQLSCKIPFDDCYAFDSRHQIILNTTPNVGNYYANYIFEKPSYSENPKVKKSKLRGNNNTLFASSSPINFNQKNKTSLYLYLLKHMFDDKKISQKIYVYAMNLLNNNNEEIIFQFDLYSKGKIQDSILIQLLCSYYKKDRTSYEDIDNNQQRGNGSVNVHGNNNNNNNINNDNIDSIEDQEVILLELKERLDADDYIIIKKMVKYGNELILNALLDYSQKKNMENLLNSIHFVLGRHKSKLKQRNKSNSSIRLSTLPLSINMHTDNNNNNNNNNCNAFIKSKSAVQSTQILTANNPKFDIKNQKTKSYQLIKIRKCLSFINKVVLEYLQLKEPKELDSLFQSYCRNEKSEDIAMMLNEKCTCILKQCLQKELQPQVMNSVLKLISENNDKVIEVFTLFRKNKYPIDQLKTDLISLDNSLNNGNNNKHKPSITEIDLCKPVSGVNKRNSLNEEKNKQRTKEKSKEKDNKDKDKDKNSSNKEKDKDKEEDNKQQDKIQAFLLDLEALSIPDKDKDQLLEMVKTKTGKLYEIINEYSNGKAPSDLKEKLTKLTNKRHFGTILTKLKSRDSPKKNGPLQIKQQPSPMPLSKQNSKQFTSFPDFLAYLEHDNQINKDKLSFLITKFNDHNEVLHSLWECYTQNNNCSDLIESILLFIQSKYTPPLPKANTTTTTTTPPSTIKQGCLHNSNNNYKSSKSSKEDPSKTPENIKNSKNDLMCFLKHNEKQIENNNNSKEKNILEKQQEIISLLFKEACIDKKTYDIISGKIKQECQCLISTFEVYAVTRDHNEFIETLQLLAELSENYKGLFMSMLDKANLEENEREILKVLYAQKQEMLFSSLELYNENKDNEELFDTFKTLCRKNKDII